MPSSPVSPSRPNIPSLGYRLLRGIVRAALRFRFRRLRLLGAEGLSDSGGAILVVGGPASFLRVLILVAALDQRARCFLSKPLCAKPLARLLARALGMVLCETSGIYSHLLVDTACEFLACGEAVVIFSRDQIPGATEQMSFVLLAARIALENESQESGRPDANMFPVHMFVPVQGSHSSEALIYFDTHPPVAEDLATVDKSLARRLDDSLRESAFRLRSEQVQQFFSDLDAILRAELEDEWATRSGWRQKVEGFELSGFVIEQVKRLNDQHPEKLIALLESVTACKEAQRLWNLRQLRIERAHRLSLRSIWRSWRNRIEAPRIKTMRKKLIEQLNDGAHAHTEMVAAA